MFFRLRLVNFKSFADATLDLGPLTLLVGTNASGKSNVREAFRFLHGLSRGYELAEILGEKWIEGGSLVWKGLRGGAREVVFRGGPRFEIEAKQQANGSPVTFTYQIAVEVSAAHPVPRVYREHRDVLIEIPQGSGHFEKREHIHAEVDPTRPGWLLARLPDDTLATSWKRNRALLSEIYGPGNGEHTGFESMRFLDLVPDALRIPSLPGQDILGDRGENLSSVLLAICEDAQRKQALLEWLRELTPLDVADFQFDSGPDGKVLVALVESDGRKTSALSASDGTLRFLALCAALLGPHTARFYFIEELDSGIHPSRLHLLVRFLEQQTAGGRTQVVATTHSPQLLGFLSEAAREHAALVYRLPGQAGARIRRVMDLPDVAEILKTQDLARLHAAGWMEDAVAFAEADAQSDPAGGAADPEQATRG